VAGSERIVEFIFKDEAFKFETLRAAGFAGDAGADIGEVIATTSQILDGDEQGWTNAWRATAERTAARGETSPAGRAQRERNANRFGMLGFSVTRGMGSEVRP
jgi:hypothetical protein